MFDQTTHYWGRPAYLDGVEVRVAIPDPLAFVNQEADYESTNYVIWDSEADSAPTNLIAVEGAEIFEYQQQPTISFIVLNAGAPPMDDVRFRRAVVSSADVESITWHSNIQRRDNRRPDRWNCPMSTTDTIQKWQKQNSQLQNTQCTMVTGNLDICLKTRLSFVTI